MPARRRRHERIFEHDLDGIAVETCVETFTTEPTMSDTFDAMDAIDAALVLNSTTNNAPPLATIASDVQQFSIHLPEASGVAPALAGVAACGWLAPAADRDQRAGFAGLMKRSVMRSLSPIAAYLPRSFSPRR